MFALALFLLSLVLAVAGPLLALHWLKPVLLPVLRSFCDAEGGAEFWMRSVQLLALSGSLLLFLSFGTVDPGMSAVEVLRRTLWLVFVAVFISVALLARNVWTRVSGLATGQDARPPSGAALR
jgi:hypothetical protein